MSLAKFLMVREEQLGGLHNAPRRTVSPLDPRRPEHHQEALQGGDRMTHHGYAQSYAGELQRFMNARVLADLETRYAGRGLVSRLQPNPRGWRRSSTAYVEHLPPAREAQVVIELGILRGVGLAIWCDVFPKARVIGLDVDLTHFNEHRPDLVRRGAFRRNKPEVYAYDELSLNNQEALARILGRGTTIDVFIDDALHYDEAIMKNFADVKPFMSRGGVYFVEDNFHVHQRLRSAYLQLAVLARRELTIVRF